MVKLLLWRLTVQFLAFPFSYNALAFEVFEVTVLKLIINPFKVFFLQVVREVGVKGTDKRRGQVLLEGDGCFQGVKPSIGLLRSCPSVLMGLCLQPFPRKPSQRINSGDNAYANKVDW